jgi:ADP-heptose:LPS heptosyltransferase
MPPNSKIKVLVIRFSSIGDIVLCTPVLRCLKKVRDKKIEIHFLTKKSFAGMMANNPHVDRVISLEKDLGAVIAALKAEKYDFIVDLHNNLRSWRVKRALGIPSSAFNKLNVEKWLLTNFKIDRMPDVHIVDRYMDAAGPLGVENDGLGLEFYIPDSDRVDISELPDGFQKGYIGFVIGGTYVTKRLPAEMIADICSKLDLPVILLGGPEDKDTGEFITGQTGRKVFNACGKFSLNASASLVEQSKAIISHDTGLMHIAAAFNKPVASIWGNTVPELGMYPYLPMQPDKDTSVIFEVRELGCRPCSKIGYDTCPKKHFRCMLDMDVEGIVNWAKNQFGK